MRKVITIGRGTDNDVQIEDGLVSRNHLQITQDDYGGYRLVDFGSKNGTYVNGRKVQGETRLSSSDVVRIGNTTLPWKSYFQSSIASQSTAFQETAYQEPPRREPLRQETPYRGTDSYQPQETTRRSQRRGGSEPDWHEVKDVNIDYNEGGFGRKFGQSAGNSAGNIVGCFIGIVIVIVLMAIIGFVLS